MQKFQATLSREVVLHGHGVHSGLPSSLYIRPAPVDHGIVFVRRDGAGGVARFHALSINTGATQLFTSLGQGALRVETIEHLMAAIAAFGLDNLEIEVTSNEMPILGGAAVEYCQAFDEAGITQQDALRAYLIIKEKVRVERGDDFAEFLPYDGCRFDVTISFPSKAIGEQKLCLDLDAKSFEQEIAYARTFGFLKDVEKLRAIGMALGSSLENSVAIGFEDEVVNPEGLRINDEFVRHKTLDAIGDSALLGAPFIGLFRSFRGGHALNAQLVKALLEQKNAYQIEVLA